MMERKVSVDSGIENPFRPGGELSREAEIIVNLIKEGKPITPTSPIKELTSEADSKILNGISNNQIPSPNHYQQLTPSTNGKLSPIGGGGTGSSTPTRNNQLNGGSKSGDRMIGGNNGGDSKVYPKSIDVNSKLNGSSKLMLIHTPSKGSTSPGIGEVEKSNVTPTEPAKADTAAAKKQKKCICCVVQ